MNGKILTPGHSAKPSLLQSELKARGGWRGQILRYSALGKPRQVHLEGSQVRRLEFLKVNPS